MRRPRRRRQRVDPSVRHRHPARPVRRVRRHIAAAAGRTPSAHSRPTRPMDSRSHRCPAPGPPSISPHTTRDTAPRPPRPARGQHPATSSSALLTVSQSATILSASEVIARGPLEPSGPRRRYRTSEPPQPDRWRSSRTRCSQAGSFGQDRGASMMGAVSNLFTGVSVRRGWLGPACAGGLRAGAVGRRRR
jgi:hypothetical protein